MNSQTFSKAFGRPPRPIQYAPLVACLISLSAWADPNPSISASGGVSPLGGSINLPHQDFNQSNSNLSSASQTVSGSAGLGANDGSYADASALAGMGQLHAYSDAHRTYDDGYYTRGDAQSGAEATFTDYILPSTNVPGISYVNYTLTLNLTGSHTSEDSHNYPGFSAMAQISWDLRNYSTGDVYAAGVFDTTDTSSNKLLVIPVVGAVPNKLMSLSVGLSTNTYVTSNDAPQYLTAVADYKDTLTVHLDAVTPGANTVGLSGYNYATAAAVPEPSSVALLLGGMPVGVWAWRRRATG